MTIDLQVRISDDKDEFSKQTTHSIATDDAVLVEFCTDVHNSGEVLDQYGIANDMFTWLRGIGVMRGSKKQQIALLQTAIVSLFWLYDSCSGLDFLAGAKARACKAAYIGQDGEELEEEEEVPEETVSAEAGAESSEEEEEDDEMDQGDEDGDL